MHRLLILSFILVAGGAARAHAAGIGLDAQAYPAGFIFTGRGAVITSAGELALHAGANFTDRRDWGEHDDETGEGFGGGLALRRSLGENWVAGVRADLWSLEIDWIDADRSGESSVWVLQPTAHVGRRWSWGENSSVVAHASLGAEINVSTTGEDVGQGAIFLLGVTLARDP